MCSQLTLSNDSLFPNVNEYAMNKDELEKVTSVHKPETFAL